MNLSPHVTVKEFTESPTAINRGISQVMDLTTTQKAKDLCENVFEPIRSYLGKPIKINSGYRSVALNRAVGGASSSQHVKGEAMDLDLHDRSLFEWIIDNIEFDQLIAEFGSGDYFGWFHISYRKGVNRKQVLRATKRNGKTIYTPYEKH
jgi:zinc D-Ala-D-Ala carboxypeptidase